MKRVKEKLKEENKKQVAPNKKRLSDPLLSPFVDSLQLTTPQKIQVVVMSIFVVPIRVLMIAIVFLLCYLFSFIISIGVAKPAIKPVGHFRTSLFNAFGRLGRVLFFCAGFYRIQIKGDRAKNVDAPLMIVAPHSSMMDMFVFFATLPLPSGLSAEKFGYLPLFSTLCKPMQPLFVSRANPQSKDDLALQISRRVNSPASWPQFVIFPEGTCTNRRALITFKLGAFIPGVPVQPVVISYLNAYDSFSWSIESPNPVILMWLSLCQFSIRASIVYLPTYYPNEDERSDPKLYANNVRSVMAEAAGLPCTEHSYEDCRLMWKAEDLNLPLRVGLIEYTAINQKLGIKMGAIEERLVEFSRIVTDKVRGVASVNDFAEYLNVSPTPAFRKLFDLYSKSETGLFNFKEYLHGFYLVSQPATHDTNLKQQFDALDADGNGTISIERFGDAVSGAFGNQVKGHEVFGPALNGIFDRISYDEFAQCLRCKPEYAKIFEFYRNSLQREARISSAIDTVSSMPAANADASSEIGKELLQSSFSQLLNNN